MSRYEKLSAHKPHILVVGDLMLDHYLWGGCERISPEAPVQVVDIKKESTLLGGAGNVINNLICFGSHVSCASVVGEDSDGKKLQAMLKKLGVKTTGLIFQKKRTTSRKNRIIASNQQIVRFDTESKDEISKKSEDELFEYIKKEVKNFDVVLLSDYCKGVLTPKLTQNIITLCKRKGVFCLVDPKGKEYSKYAGATLLTPNRAEATLATAIKIDDEKSLKSALKKLKDELNLTYSMITLSEDGMAFYDTKVTKIPTVAREVYDVTGAGDTVLSALGFGLACGLDLKQSALFATSAAGVVVGKIGSATASLDEIREYDNQTKDKNLCDKVLTKEQLLEVLKTQNHDKVVFTNGCFDILHAGHVKYLDEAKKCGRILIVGLNSDDSVKRLKGESRPINSQDDRAFVLSGLSSVDFVVVFDEDTPYELIKAIRPHVLVKGGDYEGKKVVGSELVEVVKLIEFVDGKSTTNIIQKAKA